MKKILKKVAKEYGVTVREVQAEIQACIDAAWNDPMARELQQQLFPDGKPSPALFLQRLSKHMAQNF